MINDEQRKKLKRIKLEKALNESFGAWKAITIPSSGMGQIPMSGVSGKAVAFHA